MINFWYFSSVYFCTVPSRVYILVRWPLRLNFLLRKAISLFFTVRFPLVKTLQLGDELFLRFLVLVRAFLACFIFTKQSIIFFELFFDTPTDDTLQYLLVIHQHLFHLKYPQPFPLNCDWERYLEFQEIWFYFDVHTALVNCAHFQGFKTLFSRTFTFFMRHSFSTWRFLIITPFKFNNSISSHQILKSSFFSDLWLR